VTALADAITRAISKAVAAGSDWQRGTVTAVNGTTSVDVSIGGATIPSVARLATYATAAVGDVVIVHRSSTGARYTPGPLHT
jgi:hypothetical protein